MTTAMNSTYVNALLADASYVDLNGPNRLVDLKDRLTAPLANFITNNFEVLNQQPDSLLDGFSATVWRGKAGTDYAGQVYVSMRGTDPGVDFVDDGILALTGVAYDQLASMVNWWMRATATEGQEVVQVKVLKEFVGGVMVRQIVTADTALSTGELTGTNAISSIYSVNGHSLGGYLATAFERIFGGTYPIIEDGQLPIGHVTTFNSAGYNNIGIIGANINAAFNNIATALGLPAGGFNPALQTNYYGENGFEFTTNAWTPVGFNQIGQRVALYQEDTLGSVLGGLTADPFSNHYMFKITDLLALGDAIAKIDSNFNISQLNDFVKKSSYRMEDYYEKLLDGLRKTILGIDSANTQVGDTSSTAANSSRVDYHNNLLELQNSATFQALIGKVTLVVPPTSASEARNDFGAFLSLFYLTPFALRVEDAGALNLLYAVHQSLADKWSDDRNLTSEQISNGEANFSDTYLNDRAAMLSWQNLLNEKDFIDSGLGYQTSSGQGLHFEDKSSGTIIDINKILSNKQNIIFGSISDETGTTAISGGVNSDYLYGMGGNDTLNGLADNDYLEGGANQDTLHGDDGNDVLLGGTDVDILDGGTGNDQLKGGAGVDVYQFNGTYGIDMITDTDGQGFITINNTPANSGTFKLDNIYKNEGTGYTFTKLNGGTSIVISKAGDANRIIINDWSETNNLSINLTGSAPAAPDATLTGDFRKNGEGMQFEYVDENNKYLGGNWKNLAVEANTQDNLQGTAIANAIYGYANNDALSGLGGDDYLNGGDGNDLLWGGAGSDTLIGGDGDDFLKGYENTYFLDSTDGFGFNPTAPSASSVVMGPGFGWQFSYQTPQNGIPVNLIQYELVNARVPDPSGQHDYLLQPIFYVDVNAESYEDGENVIDGGAGDDYVVGGNNNDTLLGGENNDQLFGREKDDIILGGSGNDVIIGDLYLNYDKHGNDIIDGGSGDDYIYGQGKDDVIFGGADNDHLWGDDTSANQFDGNDYLNGGAGNDVLKGGAGNDILEGGIGTDLLYGGANNDILIGTGDGDWLDGGAGVDTIYVGRDDNFKEDTADIIIYLDAQSDPNQPTKADSATASLNAALGSAGITINLANNITIDIENGLVANENITYGFGDGSEILHSDLIGTKLNSLVNLSSEASMLFGGALADNIAAIGAVASTLYGGLGDDTLTGNAANNTLQGDSGADTMAGGAGDDSYLIDDNADQITENALEGTDTVNSSITYTLSNNLENLILTGTASINGTGNELANTITGNNVTNVLNGGAGDDTLNGMAGNDSLIGDTGDDQLEGGVGNDTYLLNLGDGADVIDDMAGINTITFGAGITQASLQLSQYQGNDGSYYLRLSYGDQGDTVVIKNGLSGSIQQYQFNDGSSVSHADLIGAAGVPLYLEGSNNADILFGSNLADTFDAGDGNDTLNGEGGDDIINGDAGNDVINGGTGNDTLDGGTGNDALDGNAGQDSYVMRWGMGQDALLDSTDGEIDTIVLDAGISLLDLSSKRIGDDLLINFNTTDDGYLIKDYYVGNQQWQMQDSQGTITSVADFMAGNDSNTELEKIRNSYLASVKSTYLANLGAQGYRPLADGSMYKNETVTTPNSVTSTRYRAYYNVTTQNSDDAEIQRQSQPNTSNQTVLSVNYTTSTTYTAAPNANLFNILGARFLRFDTPRQAADGVNGPLGIPDGYKIYSSSSGSAISNEGIWIVPESYTPPLVPVTSVVFTNTKLAQNDALTLENIAAGSANNIIYADGNTNIDAGAGDDTISGFGFLYGNDGNDTITGGGIIIGGNGDDSLNGGGSADRYIFLADDVGVDTIIASGYMQGIHSETEKSAYDFWYYRSLGYADDAIFRLPSAPYIAPNDYAALAPLYVAGIIEQDTVEFGVGIDLSNLEVVYENSGNYQGGQTLTITWGLNKGVRIEMPYDEPENRYFDENGNYLITWGPSSTWGLGLGIEQFKFADGTILSMAEMLAIATAINHAPQVIGSLDNLNVGDDSAINWVAPVASLFYDGDLNDALTYSVTNADGSALPSWLNFNPTTLTLSGIPNSQYVGNYTFLITATDSQGLSANVNLTLNVNHIPGELINGTETDDVLTGTNRDDTIYGDTGADTIDGNAGQDDLSGGLGDGILTGGLGDDSLSGDEGQDTYYFNLGDGTDFIYDTSEAAEFTKIVLGAGITQSATAYSYDDGYFRMTIGQNGDQISIGDLSTEDLVSGVARVELVFAEDNTMVDFLDALTQNQIIMLGSQNADTIIGTANSEVIFASDGNDTIDGGGGADYILGGAGDDVITSAITASNAYISGGIGNDVITIASTADYAYISGDDGDDTITANTSFDVFLSGGIGNDVLNGGSGNDYLYADEGNDLLNGGAGSDTYSLYVGSGNDAVNEQNHSAIDNDTIYIDAAPANINLVKVQNDLVLQLGTDSITIKGWYLTDSNTIETLQFNDADSSIVWDKSMIADMAPPNNTAPEVSGSITPLAATDGSALNYVLPVATLFTDADQGDALTYTVTLADGNPLPSWLNYDSANFTFFGIPDPTHIGNLSLRVVATDLAGATAGIDFDLTVAAMPDQTLIGTTANNNLVGGSGNDTLDGLAGTDTMTGGYGNDTYFVERAADKVIELANQGIDTISTTVTYTASANIENLTLLGTAGITANGNELNNVLTGNTGNNTLDGKVGADAMLGSLGNDIYVVDDVADVVTELENEGTDTVRSSIDYTLGEHVERLTLTGTTAINATGNALNNILTGNDIDNQLVGGYGNDNLNGGLGADTLIGGLGNDTYVVENALDVVLEQTGEGTDVIQASVTYTLAANVENLTLTGTAAISGIGNELNNTITGNAADNQLAGGAGNDNLNGGLGADTLLGGLGNDIYTVDNVNDVVTELAGEGTDRVSSSIEYTLGVEIENLTLTGTIVISGTGNELNNTLTGNTADNVLIGNAGNDNLNGGLGADSMVGGLDNDIYTVDNVNDVVTELVDEGTDRVNSGISYTLGDNLENFTLTGAMDIMGFGNNLANVLAGNTGNNYLYGLAANDTITGNNGYDILQGGDDNDIISGNAGNGLLDGGSGNDRLTGGIENDLFIGGTGNDTIITGTGFDVIVFNKGDGADTVSASTGADNILSLGGNFAYSDLSLTKTGNNLILKMGATDQITFSNWYLSTADNKSVVNLQVIAKAIQGFSLGSADDLRNNTIENFNFANLVAAFDAAGVTANWQLTDARLTTHLQAGSDSAAIGGDLAYQYGKNSNLTGMGLINAQSVISNANFGQSAQTLNNPSVWQAELVKLG